MVKNRKSSLTSSPSWGYLGILSSCAMEKTQGRRGIEGPEAMARGESTQGTAAAHAMFGTALFGCPGSSEAKVETIQVTTFSKRLSPRVMCLMCLMCLEFFFGNAGKFPPWNSCFMSVFLKALDSTVSWHVVSGILWPKLSGNRRMIERHPKTPTTNLPAFPAFPPL